MELETRSNFVAAPNGPSTCPCRMDHPILFLLLPPLPTSGGDSMRNSTSGMVPHAITITLVTSGLCRLHEASETEFLPKTTPTAEWGTILTRSRLRPTRAYITKRRYQMIVQCKAQAGECPPPGLQRRNGRCPGEDNGPSRRKSKRTINIPQLHTHLRSEPFHTLEN